MARQTDGRTLSAALHSMFFRDCEQSLCARAYSKREESRSWCAFMHIMDFFDKDHCKRSWEYYHKEGDT